MSRSSLRVQFAHGLESGPGGAKARFLAEHFTCETPAMDTRDFEASVALHARTLERFCPDVLVGSSFGGAVAVALLARGLWRGRTLLLAPALAAFGIAPKLPQGVAVTVVHGLRDEVVPIDTSRNLAKTGTAGLVRLIELHDDHPLRSLVTTGTLAELVEALTQPRDARLE